MGTREWVLILIWLAVLLGLNVPWFDLAASPAERPYGYLVLGTTKDFIGRITYLPKLQLMIVGDDHGLAAFSTVASGEQQPLTRILTNDKYMLRSEESGQFFTELGEPVDSSAAALEHYRLLRDASPATLGLDHSKLVVVVGDLRPTAWRLELP